MLTAAESDAAVRELAERLWRFVAERWGAPGICLRADCRRSSECLGRPQACRPALEAALEVEKVNPEAAKPLVRQALVHALAETQAEALAAPSGTSQGATVRSAWAPAPAPAATEVSLASLAAFAKQIEERSER